MVMRSALLLSISLTVVGQAVAAETLYNNIELPDVWPPRDMDARSLEPMRVPYLQHPPQVIAIDVGRQLFVDDFLVESTNLKRRFHTAKKYEGNPVFKPETPRELAASSEWEKDQEAMTFLGQGGVFYDPAEKHFKMYYNAGWRGPLALATSTDMHRWQRPELGLAGGNTLLPNGLRWTGAALTTGGADNSVWFDLDAKPEERVKYMTCWTQVPKDQRVTGVTHTLHVSDGAKKWSDGAPTGHADDYCSFFYNPFRQKWCYSIKRGGPRGRSRWYSENSDFMRGADWAGAVYWTNADRLDAPEPEGRYPGAGETPQLYGLNAVAYESLMVGVHYVHRGPKNEICDRGKFPKLIDLELGFSRDGFHWDRPDRRGFIVGSRTEGSWDRGYLQSTTGVFVVMGDQLIFPYMGASGIAPNGNRGMYTGGAVGLATLRRDGFASMDVEAGKGSGLLATRAVKFKGGHLFVNAATGKGELWAELVDDAGKVVAVSKKLTGDATKQKLDWVDRPDVAEFAGRAMRLRFHLTEGSLYAFWITPDASGASNGYLGAGGPEYGGVRDVAPAR